MAQIKIIVSSFLITFFMPFTEGGIPGEFFWKPRMGLDMTAGSIEAIRDEDKKPKMENVRRGVVVFIDGYETAMTVLALVHGINDAQHDVYFNPTSAYYYSDVYRWAKRHLDMIPEWLGGDKPYIDTQKVWKRRFYHSSTSVPNWFRSMLFFVKKQDWIDEETDLQTYLKYSAPEFEKYHFYPGRYFKNYDSHRLNTEEIDDSSIAMH